MTPVGEGGFGTVYHATYDGRPVAMKALEGDAINLKDVLKSIPGIRTSETWAYPPRELRVEVDLQRLAELKLPIGRVLQALESENANIPAGVVDIDRHIV